LRILIWFSLIFSITFGQSRLEIGMKAPDWEFPDADGTMFTMGNWAGKILQVNYVDPDESEMNEAFNDAVKHAVDVEKRIERDTFQGIGVADCASTWKPNFAIRLIGGAKAKKYDTTVLFDYDAVLRDSWGLNKNSYSIIIVDEDRIVRVLERGKIPKERFEEIILTIIELQE